MYMPEGATCHLSVNAATRERVSPVILYGPSVTFPRGTHLSSLGESCHPGASVTSDTGRQASGLKVMRGEIWFQSDGEIWDMSSLRDGVEVSALLVSSGCLLTRPADTTASPRYRPGLISEVFLRGVCFPWDVARSAVHREGPRQARRAGSHRLLPVDPTRRGARLFFYVAGWRCVVGRKGARMLAGGERLVPGGSAAVWPGMLNRFTYRLIMISPVLMAAILVDSCRQGQDL
uniref:Uncharacterized protein n=1 Tax=Branchiostoma floridae TaxID=7739 RepID=C3XUZ6_BRAFL|eukprot:XP_002611913.1 hypothetical protein BRAFLDRAFT_106509 [Branchiostoma floridae]